MQVMTLFDGSGKIHALFKPSANSDAPKLRFHPAPGHQVEMLEVPAELRGHKLAQLHGALQVDLSQGTPRLRARAAN
jgi:hypothetical protein